MQTSFFKRKLTITQKQPEWIEFSCSDYKDYIQRHKITDEKALKLKTLDSTSKMDFLLNRKPATTTQQTSTVAFESQRSFTVNIFENKQIKQSKESNNWIHLRKFSVADSSYRERRQ